ncbi:MAG: pyridoxal-phosphate dependent enzyme [Acidobacteria bacterium]|nr:pyridoxal-phosphate dependent enzyme [Acidobacteriota bacterium]NIM62314.1 pyridoxal-phosphate dependent enzyme [Acidobacteriota bacterium]NIO58255.1 pyridoxal-phosphate dependent enzyme [Acidobacteriota bacterium]NIQ29284.1 pyridoxal-phosphate dependent enzyme [Acidobacteriota bacterium]NIQ83883.1 pyridoxal-phosphate dependent enzyme [Acidobacteriota bacterium]
MLPTIDDVRAAARRIAPHTHRTPVLSSSRLSEELGIEAFFKCENLQKVGAFKARGATNAVLSLDEESAARGVVTHSSGNHGAALAYAAAARGVPCVVVMPRDAPEIKVAAVRGYGAEIVLCERAEREAACRREIEERGMTLIHPYEDPRVIAGQGTAALELLEQVDELDRVIAPVGGGGLLSGTALTVSSLAPGIEVWGAEPAAVDDAHRSLESGTLQPGPVNPRSWGDGLLTGLGKNPFAILKPRGVRVVTVEENAMLDAAWTLIRRLKVVVEPSGATVLAALRARADQWKGRRVGAIISGGNTDFAWLSEL